MAITKWNTGYRAFKDMLKLNRVKMFIFNIFLVLYKVEA